MQVQEYIEQKKELHDAFLNYIDSEETESEETENELISIFQAQKISEDRNELLLVLNLISRITKNHHRHPTLFGRIEKIFNYFLDKIRHTFSDLDLFDIFKNNKLILLYLIEKKLITINEFFFNYIMGKYDKKNRNLPEYFYPEIRKHLNETDLERIKNKIDSLGPSVLSEFDQNRRKGENHSYLTKLIRDDSIEDFVTYYNKNGFSLNDQIDPSPFETNSYLIGKTVSIIEYAAFFGSIQIFQYLQLNGVDLTPSLWMYSIHGNNPSIIHILEENKIKFSDEKSDENKDYQFFYHKFMKEALKCHHNDIANYFFVNFSDQEKERENINDPNKFGENILSDSYQYYNLSFLSNFIDNEFNFYYACKYNYAKLYEIILDSQYIDINEKVVFYIFFEYCKHFNFMKSNTIFSEDFNCVSLIKFYSILNKNLCVIRHHYDWPPLEIAWKL